MVFNRGCNCNRNPETELRVGGNVPCPQTGLVIVKCIGCHRGDHICAVITIRYGTTNGYRFTNTQTMTSRSSSDKCTTFVDGARHSRSAQRSARIEGESRICRCVGRYDSECIIKPGRCCTGYSHLFTRDKRMYSCSCGSCNGIGA